MSTGTEIPNLAANFAFGVLETKGWTPAIVALDAMEKAASIRVWQVELNDMLGTCVKIVGSVDSVIAAIAVGLEIAEQMQGSPASSTVIPRMSAGGSEGNPYQTDISQISTA